MADDGGEASEILRKRPSPTVGDGDVTRGSKSGFRSDSAMSLDGPSPHPNKRPRTTSPKKTSVADVDSYAFPDDDQSIKSDDAANIVQSKSIPPLVAMAKSLVVPKIKSSSSSPTRPDTSIVDLAPADAESEATADAKAGTETEAAIDATDDAYVKPDWSLETLDAEQETEVDTIMGGTEDVERPSISEKKPPSTKIEPPPPPPAGVKLRQPQKLKRLREQSERKQEEAEQRLSSQKTSEDEQAREGLRRALALALDHVGFSSATEDALESFLLMTETYFQSLAEDVAHFALAGRRTQPIPIDLDASLARFNIGTSALRPHLRNPINPSKRVPQPTYDLQFEELQLRLQCHLFKRRDSDYGDLPLLSHDLSGKPEKESKSYIPGTFPAFPSIHTYRNTPIDVDTVTVQGSGLRYDDGSLLLLPSEEASAEDRDLGLGYAPLLDGTVRTRDPKRIREAAAVEAKQAEEALRGLMRASKVNKLKEVRAAADRSSLNKKRYTLWEAAMRELIVDAKQQHRGGGGGAAVDTSQGTDASPSKAAKSAAAALREEIADQSMMVNAEKTFHRKEIPRKTRKMV